MNKLLLFFLLFTSPALSQAQENKVSKTALFNVVQSLEKQSGGEIGLAVLDLRTGKRFHYKAGKKYPMASVYKFPIALHVLH